MADRKGGECLDLLRLCAGLPRCTSLPGSPTEDRLRPALVLDTVDLSQSTACCYVGSTAVQSVVKFFLAVANVASGLRDQRWRAVESGRPPRDAAASHSAKPCTARLPGNVLPPPARADFGCCASRWFPERCRHQQNDLAEVVCSSAGLLRGSPVNHSQTTVIKAPSPFGIEQDEPLCWRRPRQGRSAFVLAVLWRPQTKFGWDQ